MAASERGVQVPVSGQFRSTSALGRAVVADALRRVDPVGARAAEAETAWRQGYLVHFRRLVEAGLLSADAAGSIARDGLDALHRRLRHASGAGEVALADALPGDPAGDGEPLGSATVAGTAQPQRELVLPYRGQRLRGDDLLRQLDRWVAAGVMEPSAADAVRAVVANPDWLDLSDRRVVVLGAGAEMGPLRSVLRWGGEVVAVDVPRAEVWQRVLAAARRHAGRVTLPVSGEDPDLARRAGVDLLTDLPRVAAWLAGVDAPMVLGNYVYADGVLNLRVAAAVDALTRHLLATRRDVALAFLATPTDVFAVPAEAVAEATGRYAARQGIGRVRGPIRALSAGRLLTRNYPPGADPGIHDALVLQQGPNYALAKRLQRWRAVAARHDGVPVSLNVAPATRTRSVLRNRALAAAYAGAHRFGVEVFEPATSNTLMAALLVHDLRAPAVAREHPWLDEAACAVHGGLWRQPYAPRSVLGLAAVLGFAGARG
jgi:hypothetical protein